MAAVERSLDIPEAQLLVWRDADADGVPWHHCVCLARAGGAGRWVALDPDFRLVTLNLGDVRFQVLGRKKCFGTETNGYAMILTDDSTKALNLNVFAALTKQWSQIGTTRKNKCLTNTDKCRRKVVVEARTPVLLQFSKRSKNEKQ